MKRWDEPTIVGFSPVGCGQSPTLRRRRRHWPPRAGRAMFAPMRAAFITADVLVATPDGVTALRRLDEAGLFPVVLVPQPLPAATEARPDTGGYPLLACATGNSACWGEQPELLLEAAAVAGVALGEAFFVCAKAVDLARGVAAGCRPVLVLSGRTLDDVYGPDEPPHKDAAAAVDLAAAVGYMTDEAAHSRQLGAFAFAPHGVLDEVPRTPPLTRGDMTKIFLLITIAGIAVALGIAYLLQEIYQNFQFPRFSYYLTLQFIPQWLRGFLFILMGVGIGFMVPRLIGGMRARRAYRT